MKGEFKFINNTLEGVVTELNKLKTTYFIKVLSTNIQEGEIPTVITLVYLTPHNTHEKEN